MVARVWHEIFLSIKLTFSKISRIEPGPQYLLLQIYRKSGRRIHVGGPVKLIFFYPKFNYLIAMVIAVSVHFLTDQT